MGKVHKLIPLKDNVKVIENDRAITVDITIPLDREDFNFLKKMYEMDVDVSGRILDREGFVVTTFSNAVRSVGQNRVSLDIKSAKALIDNSPD